MGGGILFINDNMDNILTAEKLGFKTLFLSDNHKELKVYIDKLDFVKIRSFISGS